MGGFFGGFAGILVGGLGVLFTGVSVLTVFMALWMKETTVASFGVPGILLGLYLWHKRRHFYEESKSEEERIKEELYKDKSLTHLSSLQENQIELNRRRQIILYGALGVLIFILLVWASIPITKMVLVYIPPF